MLRLLRDAQAKLAETAPDRIACADNGTATVDICDRATDVAAQAPMHSLRELAIAACDDDPATICLSAVYTGQAHRDGMIDVIAIDYATDAESLPRGETDWTVRRVELVRYPLAD